MARLTVGRRSWGGTALGAALLAALLAALTLPVWPGLRVTHGGDVLAELPEDHFTVSYVHSIDGLPIEEDLRTQDGRLVVERTRLVQFGAGMGQIAGEGRGYAEGRWWVVDDLDRDIGDELLLRVGVPRIDHRLRAGEHELALSSCLPGEQVRVAPARLTTSALLTGGSVTTDRHCQPRTTATKEDS